MIALVRRAKKRPTAAFRWLATNQRVPTARARLAKLRSTQTSPKPINGRCVKNPISSTVTSYGMEEMSHICDFVFYHKELSVSNFTLVLSLAKRHFYAKLATQLWNCFSFFPNDGPIVYRLGHQVFILVRGVRLPLGLPTKIYQTERSDLS